MGNLFESFAGGEEVGSTKRMVANDFFFRSTCDEAIFSEGSVGVAWLIALKAHQSSSVGIVHMLSKNLLDNLNEPLAAKLKVTIHHDDSIIVCNC